MKHPFATALSAAFLMMTVSGALHAGASPTAAGTYRPQNPKSFNPQPDPPTRKSLGGPDTKSLGGPDTKSLGGPDTKGRKFGR